MIGMVLTSSPPPRPPWSCCPLCRKRLGLVERVLMLHRCGKR